MKPSNRFLKQVTIAAICFLFMPCIGFAQIDLGTTASFKLFTSNGAVENTGRSNITGNVGANIGAITGFGIPSIISGNIYNADLVTQQCSIDLGIACTQLDNVAATSTTHAVIFGNGETLFAGVYTIGAAGSVSGILTLDAQGDPNAIFIFRIGGAFTTAALASVRLINNAKSSNIFWKATGAIAMAAGTVMKGTLIANAGAISLAAGGMLEGRMFSTTGAVSIDQSLVYFPGELILPVTLIDFNAVLVNKHVELSWTTDNERAFASYHIERSSDGHNFYDIGEMPASNTLARKTYKWTDNDMLPGASFYRLKMMDIDGHFKYSGAAKIQASNKNTISVFPNPGTGKNIQLQMHSQPRGNYSLTLFSRDGKRIMSNNIFHSGADDIKTILLDKNLSKGIYYLKIIDPQKEDKMLSIIVN